MIAADFKQFTSDGRESFAAILRKAIDARRALAAAVERGGGAVLVDAQQVGDFMTAVGAAKDGEWPKSFESKALQEILGES